MPPWRGEGAAAAPDQLSGLCGLSLDGRDLYGGGQGSKDQGETRRFAYADPQGFGAIIDAIVEMTIDYLAGRVANGVEAVQLFDSWAGSLSPAPVRTLGDRAQCRDRRGFPGAVRGAGDRLPQRGRGQAAAYARETEVDAVGLDETVDPVWADTYLPKGLPVQGNLDPLALIAGGEALDGAVDRILAAFTERPHIFNLGHGILPDTPIAHVERLIARVRNKHDRIAGGRL